MSFGYGMEHCKSSKQKLNTKISTEGEEVGVSDYLPYNIWIFLFMGAQGYDIKQKKIRDNQSAIKMEKNGKELCTGKFRNIHIRYFCAKDRVERKKMSIAYCITSYARRFFY